MVRWFKNLKIAKKILLGNGIAVFCLLFFSLQMSSSIESTLKDQFWIIHTEKVITTGHHLMECLLDLETGERGFLITGQREFLEPYESSLKDLFFKLDKAKVLVSDNPAQVKQLEKIEKLTKKWIGEVGEKAIDMRKAVVEGGQDWEGVTREGTFEEVKALVQSKVGKNIMDRLRIEIDKFSNHEEELLLQRLEKSSESVQKTRIILLVGALAGSLLIMVAGWAISLTINRPLKKFVDVADSITRGEHSRRVEVSTNDELGDLAQSFNKMVIQLGKVEESLAWRSKELEGKNLELEEKNKELDEFAYIASHDLQEPLRKITSFSSIFEKDMGGQLPERAEKDLFFITDAAKRMQVLIQDLLTLSRSGRSAVKFEKMSLAECQDAALKALEGLMEVKRARIVRSEDQEVVGDFRLLTQLYQNLIGNAVKFTKEGESPLVHLTAEERNGERIFGVRDNGIGINPEYGEFIFSPFKRLHGRSHYEGSGIGLAICRKVIERHRGRIWVESDEGKGAHFLFVLGVRERKRREERVHEKEGIPEEER